MKRSLVRKCCYLQCSRHIFFKEAALGRPKVCNCRQTHFFHFGFYICRFFSRLGFLAALWWKMRLILHTVVLWEGGCEFCPLPGVVSGKRFYEQNLCFTKGIWCFFLKTSILLNVFHLFLPWLASGAPLGPWAPPWRPFLDLSGGISGLGSSLGPFLGASVSFLVCFYCFSTSHGIIFSKFKV